MVLVTEQGDRPLTPFPAPEQLSNKDSRWNRSTRSENSASRPEVENGGERRPRRRVRSPAELQLCLDTESEPSENKKKPPTMRLKPVAQLSPMLSPSYLETKLERKKSQSSQLSKTNAQYHKLFKEVGKDEWIKQSYTCALQKDILYQGKMFVSDNWICFHSKVFGKDTKISIPVTSVTLIKKTNTVLLVPNALVIETESDQHVFVSFLSRNTTYKFLKSICIHLEGDKTGSPVTSSCENSFRVSCPSSLPLVFAGEFPDLDGVVQQRWQKMMESSSSGSQTPDYEKATDFTHLPDTFLSAVKSGEVSVHADVHLQTSSQKHGAVLKNAQVNAPLVPIKGHEAAGPCAHTGISHRNSKVVRKSTMSKSRDGSAADSKQKKNFRSAKPTCSTAVRDKSSQPKSLHAILLIYLFLVSVLVLSSCYMAYKIVALEHRLNSLVPVGEYIRTKNAVSQRSQDKADTEIYGELSTNLFKLEKVQRNLQKLLDET